MRFRQNSIASNCLSLKSLSEPSSDLLSIGKESMQEYSKSGSDLINWLQPHKKHIQPQKNQANKQTEKKQTKQAKQKSQAAKKSTQKNTNKQQSK